MADLSHNELVLSTLEVGDRIEIPRGVYSHWGVYMGNKKIVHLTGVDNDGNNRMQSGPNQLFSACGKTYDKAEVKEDNFLDVAGTSKAKKNNEIDRKCKPLPKEEIVERARSKIGPKPYNVLQNNCEHFSTWCRNGENRSEQTESVLKGTLIGSAVVVVGGLTYAMSRIFTKEKKDK